MKYYLFQGTVGKMEDKFFEHLLKNEPTAQELTKEDYENRMGIKPQGQAGQKSANVGSAVGPHSEKQTESPVQGSETGFTGTKKQLIDLLKERGTEHDPRQTKEQLLKLL
jgi:hypothetical protein